MLGVVIVVGGFHACSVHITCSEKQCSGRKDTPEFHIKSSLNTHTQSVSHVIYSFHFTRMFLCIFVFCVGSPVSVFLLVCVMFLSFFFNFLLIPAVLPSFFFFDRTDRFKLPYLSFYLVNRKGDFLKLVG